MATFYERFLKHVKVSTVHPTDFANSRQPLIETMTKPCATWLYLTCF